MKIFAVVLLLAIVVGPAAAQADVDADALDVLRSDLDFVWILAASALVFLMQAGFMALESGMSRAKNSINIAVKNMADFVIAVAGFWIIGFGLMFGASAGGLVGTTDFFVDVGSSPWRAVFFVFQAVFVGTAATIDSGAVAERTRFSSYVLVSAMTSVLFYPIFGHWAWGSFLSGGTPGWLEARGFLDFAGSTVVHSVGAWVALAGVIVVGPRIGRFDADGRPRKIPPHNLVLVYLGVFILFFGWFGFNAGSTLAATPAIAGITLNTMLAAVFGALSAGALNWWLGDAHIPEAEAIANGLLAGLVGITAGCAFVESGGAVVIGLVSGAVMYGGSLLLERLGIDDVVGAIPVHGFAGVWGTVAVALFITPDQLAALGNTRVEQLGIQFLGVATAFLWVFPLAFGAQKLISVTIGMRVSAEDEQMGLNIAEHGATSSLIGLARSMQRVAETGTYDEDLVVEAEHGTEIGELAEYFNSMLHSLISQRERITRVERKQKAAMKKVTEGREEERRLHSSLQEQQQAADMRLRNFSRQMGENVEAIGTQLDDVNRILGDSTALSDAMVSSFGTMVTQMERMLQSFASITSSTGSAAELVSRSAATVGETSGTVDRLNQAAKRIQGIIETIEDIADRTRILSINAGIEAARAGDAGSGFRVVAGEVRALADNTSASAREIAEYLEEIRSTSAAALTGITSIHSIIETLESQHQHIGATTRSERENVESMQGLMGRVQSDVENVRQSIDAIRAGTSAVRDRVVDSNSALGDVLTDDGGTDRNVG